MWFCCAYYTLTFLLDMEPKAELGFVPGVPFRAVFGSWISGGKGKVMGKGSGRRCSYPETTVVSIFPSPMHYVGSAQQKCSGMQRVGSMRGPTFRSWVGTQLVAAYDKTQGKMAFFDPSRSQDFLFISGTKLIGCLNTTDASARKERREPSGWVMCPGGWKVLVDYYDSLAPTGNGKVAKPVPAYKDLLLDYVLVWEKLKTIFTLHWVICSKVVKIQCLALE
ncbi:hypothetical protein RHMOL_Rhmol02G0032000 [Rhododendron molle]|uniref:Uncharacterized protein n=2 Tax=Rhododendron molle TaxID=49168 RepID=A0ACC0PNE0_RHOML|nr:hypothetical protein RHMOL_Rhmol02G0032000 [Rhododendron molle]KAI8566325.1 hypothetical protein RHMOL_Rhmol02G0032000 [Rhododendron molle]